MFKLDPQERLIRAVVKRFGMCFLTLGLCLSATGCARMARAFPRTVPRPLLQSCDAATIKCPAYYETQWNNPPLQPRHCEVKSDW